MREAFIESIVFPYPVPSIIRVCVKVAMDSTFQLVNFLETLFPNEGTRPLTSDTGSAVHEYFLSLQFFAIFINPLRKLCRPTHKRVEHLVPRRSESPDFRLINITHINDHGVGVLHGAMKVLRFEVNATHFERSVVGVEA